MKFTATSLCPFGEVTTTTVGPAMFEGETTVMLVSPVTVHETALIAPNVTPSGQATPVNPTPVIVIVVPPVVNDFIALFKDTSVCSVVTVVELTKRYSVLSQSTQATVELMAMTAVLYLAMSWPLSVASRRLEERFGAGVHA